MSVAIAFPVLLGQIDKAKEVEGRCDRPRGGGTANRTTRIAKQVGANKPHIQKLGFFKKPDF
jgi:hypothetical protein